MNPSPEHIQRKAAPEGGLEEAADMQRSMSPPTQLFADPSKPVQRQEPKEGEGDPPGAKAGAAAGAGATAAAAASGGAAVGAAGLAIQTLQAAAAALAATLPPPNKLVAANARTTSKVSDAVQPSLDKAVNDVLAYTGVDIGVGFGDTVRPIGQGTAKVGADNFSWHKSGRAVDFNQGLKWLIMLDPSGGDTYFRLYLEANDAGKTSAYAKTFTAADKANIHHNGAGGDITKKTFVDVTAILNAQGFTRIPAHTGWESSYNKREWWHYVKEDGLNWYQALRQLYTDAEIVTAMKKLVVDRHNSGGRLKREGFPDATLKAIWDNKPVTMGKLSLYLSVGAADNCANLTEDVNAVKTALIGLGIADAGIVDMIKAYQKKKGAKTPDGSINVGGTTHSNIGSEMK